MPEETNEAVEGSEATGATIRPDTSDYANARAAGGGMSKHNGDPVATGLVGMNVDEVAKVASALIPDSTPEALIKKYSHLNIGQQRMNLGNRVRGAIAKINKANAALIAKTKEGEKAPAVVSGESQFEAAVKPMRRDIDARMEAARKAADEKKKEVAARKEAKAKEVKAKKAPADAGKGAKAA